MSLKVVIMQNIVVSRDKLVSVLTCILMIINSVIYSSNILAILIIALSLYLLQKKEYLFPPLLISTYFQDAGMLLFITSQRYFTLLFMLRLFIDLVIGGRKISKQQLDFVIIFAFMAFQTIRVNISMELDFWIFFMNISCALLITRLNPKYVRDCFDVVVVGIFFSIICLLISFVSSRSIDSGNFSYLLLEELNENVMGMALEQMGIILFAFSILYQVKNKKIERNTCYIGVLLTFILLVATGSRGGLLGFFAGILVGIGVQLYIYRKNVKKYFLTLFGVLSLLLLGTFLFITFIMRNSQMLYRFDLSLLIESGGTGRMDIWRIVWSEGFLKHPILGIGVNSEQMIRFLYSHGNYHSGTHNMVLDIAARTGIVGIVVLGMFMIENVQTNIDRINKQMYYSIIPLLLFIGLFTNGVAENIWFYRFFWIVLGMTFWICNSDEGYIYNNQQKRGLTI